MGDVLTTYREALDALFARTTGQWKLGLERMQALLHSLGDPHLRLRTFHVGQVGVCQYIREGRFACSLSEDFGGQLHNASVDQEFCDGKTLEEVSGPVHNEVPGGGPSGASVSLYPCLH